MEPRGQRGQGTNKRVPSSGAGTGSRAYSQSYPRTNTSPANAWNQQYGPGSSNLAVYQPGQTTPVRSAEPDYASMIQPPGMMPGGPQPATAGPMGSMYGGGNSGGGRQGPSAAQLAAVNQAFTLDESPYWMMQAGINNQRAQANAYNPDFAGITRTAQEAGARIEGERASAVQARLAELAGLGQTLAGQQAGAMAGAARDLGGQGYGIGNYMGQANQMGADRVGALGNQGQYMAMLNANAANANADYQRGLGTIQAGGEAGLANSRLAIGNQLDMQTASIQQQAAAARAANNQAKLQFMLQQGMVA